MTTILITYLIVINLIGFALMGIDKRRAVKDRWRISEKTLFLVALLFGCVGSLIGMYFFRHKTRHLSFRIGLPAILILQPLLIALGVFMYSHFTGRPTQVVRRELRQIRELDDETLRSLAYYTDPSDAQAASADVSDITSDTIALFFKNFKYKILDEKIEDDQAVVDVSITNIDSHALAQDLCTEILKRSASVYPESTTSTDADYYQLLYDTLSEKTYELVTTPAVFHLQKKSSRWEILSDEALEDDLTGGFLTCMNDPYIIPAATALSIQLDALKDLTAEQWAEYLSVNDIFATYNTDYYRLIDNEYIRQLAEAFDYEIMRCVENGASATASVRITSIDMKNVLAIYKKHLLAYAATTKSLRDDDVQFSNETSYLLLQSLKENKKKASTDIDINFQNNGSVWEISFDQAFTNALMGNISGAIDQFTSAAHDPGTVIVAPVD